ncbi:uncharacterized protein [Nicotiana sylvestris]|uniref:uncharacterized protein n=1 Tax=Nicotiana sylvestris TaxID=4096 RepID=UPI00388C56E0
MPKTSKEYTDAARKAVEKNVRAKKILVYGIGPDEYNRISTCDTAKAIWMKDDESIQDMHTRFTSIINELHSLGETNPRNKPVWKILSILHSPWESKVNAITEAKDLQELTIEELVGNLKTYKMKRKIDSERREPKLVLKSNSNDSSEEDSDMAYLTKRIQKIVRRNGEMLRRGSFSKPKNYDLCHKCGKPGHFIKDYPLLKQVFSKYNPEKADKRNPISLKEFKRKRFVDNVVKHALAAWGIPLVNDDKNNGNKEVNFRDVQRNLKSYSPKKLMSLANVLIDAHHNLLEDKDDLILELREADKTRDDLVVCVVDLKETICELKKEKNVLTKRISNLEHERYDLVVVVIDHKETIKNFSEENEALAKRVTKIEEERDDLLVEIAGPRKTMEGPRTKSKPRNTGKGKEIAREEHIRLENELKGMRTRMCVEAEKNKHIQTELERVKNDLENSLKWTWSLEDIIDMYTNNGGNR